LFLPTHHQIQIQMDKEEQTQLEASKESEVPEMPKITEENKTVGGGEQSKDLMLASEQSPTNAKEEEEIIEITGAEAAEQQVKEETKEAEEISETVAAQTTELVKELEPDLAPDSAALVLASVTPNLEEEETNEITEQVKDGPQEADFELEMESPDPNSVTASAVSETLAAEKIVGLPDATTLDPLVVSDFKIGPVTETNEPTKEESEALDLADPKLEAKLPQVETAGPQFPDTSVAETHEVENKETELGKEETKELEFPDSSLAVTPVVDAELIPEAAEVTKVHAEKEKLALDELKVDNTDASAVLAESVDAESEVTQVLPEKKKKRALGDHLAEEKANDSEKANKQASGEKPEAEPSKVEQIASAVALKENTEISSRDVNITGDTKTEADEEEEKNEKVVEHAAGEVAATETAQEVEGEKESVATGKAVKEEVASKPTPRSSNNVLSKVKHQIVKVKKAIVKRSRSSKNMPVENKDDIKVK
jgi:hypothetical protein